VGVGCLAGSAASTGGGAATATATASSARAPGALRRPMTWGDPRGLSGASYTIRVRFNRW
ncbi:hypothetical protein, partial [Streptomyces europaeiscabiei]|uniref:hypothetical protein n=1 Tax=Streptomyces europaeiscabiei TaxID=146819 RepID=UPI000AF70411